MEKIEDYILKLSNELNIIIYLILKNFQIVAILT